MEQASVLSGQQLNLLGGSLLIVYKILGAHKLAMEKRLRPVYWLEANDSDFEEISRLYLINKWGALECLKWDKYTGGLSCGLIKVDRALVDMINQFFNHLEETQYTTYLREGVLQSFQEGRLLVDASCELARFIFEDYPMTYFSPFDENFRRYTHPILLRELERTPSQAQANVFTSLQGRRKALFRRGDQFVTREGERINPSETILLPNVRTRNLCQDAYHQGRFYVGGPGEERYIAQLDDDYAFHGVEKAEFIRRMSVFLIEPDVQAVIARREWSLEAILNSTRSQFKKEILEGKVKTPSVRLFEEALRSKDEFIDKLVQLGYSKRMLEGHLYRRLRVVHGQYKNQFRRRHRLELREVDYIYDRLYPYDMKQERCLNIFYYFNRYGKNPFLKTIYDGYYFSKDFSGARGFLLEPDSGKNLPTDSPFYSRIAPTKLD